MTTANVILTPRGEFSLAHSIRFLSGFTPLSYGGDPEQPLRLAFCVEGDWQPVAVRAHQTASGRVSATIEHAEPQRARDQLERMLSLDVDAAALEKTVARDRVAGRLVHEYRGLRPVCFASPYEAACWAVLSQRVHMRQAAKIRVHMCERLGQAHAIDDCALHSFPDPGTLRATRSIKSLSDTKVQRLHAIAEAALDGRLDGAALRAAGPEQAIEDVQQIPGIGPFGADLVVIRGAGEPDHFSRTERRLHQALADAYGADARDIDGLASIAEGWKPFRSWIGFLFRTRLAMSSAGSPTTRSRGESP